MKPYQLSDELEKFLHQQSVVGATAWNKLFDETIANLKFNINKKSFSLEEVLNQLSDPERKNREKAAKSLSLVLKKNISLFSRITNTLAKEKSIGTHFFSNGKYRSTYLFSQRKSLGTPIFLRRKK